MNIKDYKSGTYKQQNDYQTFLPSLINHTWICDTPQINMLLETASRELGGLNSYSELIPNIDIYKNAYPDRSK